MLKLTNSPSKKKKQKQNNNNDKKPEKPLHSSRLFPVAWGYGGHILVLNPESQGGGGVVK